MQARHFAGDEINFNDIKTELDLRSVQQAQPVLGTAPYELPFLFIYRICRAAKIITRAGFHFDEGQDLAMPGDNVHLPAKGGAVVPV